VDEVIRITPSDAKLRIQVIGYPGGKNEPRGFIRTKTASGDTNFTPLPDSRKRMEGVGLKFLLSPLVIILQIPTSLFRRLGFRRFQFVAFRQRCNHGRSGLCDLADVVIDTSWTMRRQAISGSAGLRAARPWPAFAARGDD